MPDDGLDLDSRVRVQAVRLAWNELTADEQEGCARAIIDCLGWSVVDMPPLYPPPDPLRAPLSARKKLLADLWRRLPASHRARFLAVATAEGFTLSPPTP